MAGPSRTPLLILAVVGAVLGTQAAAADLPAGATKLSLRETATAMVSPDILVATLRAEARGDTGTVQQTVNRLMADALAKAKAAHELTVSTGSYTVYQTWQPPSDPKTGEPPHPVWAASQSITLSSKQPDKLLELAGALQKNGLLMADIHGELSADLRAATQDRLVREALARLRTQVAVAAEAMELKFAGYSTVRIDKEQQAVPWQPANRAMAMAAAAPPPSAQPAEQQVSVTAEAEAILQPPAGH
jgi:uncharacterized protein